MNRAVAACSALLLCSLGGIVEAHQPSESYLRVQPANDNELAGRWDIALLDLEHAVGLDDDGDGNITWGELNKRRDAVASYALAHLTISVGDEICTTNTADVRVDDHGDVMYAVLAFEAVCPRAASGAQLRYDLFFDLDPTHRGLLVYDTGGAPATTVLSPEQRVFTLADRPPGIAATFVRFLREGVHHIAAGYDHIAFIVLLLLPAGLARGKTFAAGERGARLVTRDILGVVTAFTIAHSLTLGLAATGVIALPSSLVEPAIAASIIVAALGNLWPPFHARRWSLAFGFGLVHGFGFANVLGQLDLRGAALAVPLAAFNIGVEVGQLLIAAAALPLLLVLRHRVVYRRFVIPGGSTAIAVLAGYWLVQRLVG